MPQFPFPHPVVNQGAGRVKSDCLNDQRIETILDRFYEVATEQGRKLNFLITKEQVDKSRVLFPLTGLAIGVIGSYTFVHPGSNYIGKIFTLFSGYLGYLFYQRHYQSYNVFRYFGNYDSFPPEIKKAVDNHDARYAYNWLQDDYKAKVAL